MGAAGRRGPPTARPAARRRSAHLKPQRRLPRGRRCVPAPGGVSEPSTAPAPRPRSGPGPHPGPHPGPRAWPELSATAVLKRPRTGAGAGALALVPEGSLGSGIVGKRVKGWEEKGAEVLTRWARVGATQDSVSWRPSCRCPKAGHSSSTGATLEGKWGRCWSTGLRDTWHLAGPTRLGLRGGFALWGKHICACLPSSLQDVGFSASRACFGFSSEYRVNHSSKITTDLIAVSWHKKIEGSENTRALTGLVKHDSEVSLE